MIRVSVVIPCFNVEGYMGPCLHSVLGQTHPDVEIIVVDDGSSDGTVSEVERMQAAHPGRITLLRQQNQGACVARNAGMRAATGTWIQFLDADDRLLPEKIAGQVALAQDTGAQVVVGGYVKELPDGGTRPEHPIEEGPWMGLIKTRLGTTSADLWQRAAVEAVGGWDEELASSQDYELLFRLLKAGTTVAFDPRPATHVVKRDSGSISRTAVKDNWLRYIALRVAIRDHLRSDTSLYAAELGTLDQYLFMAIHLLAQDDLPLALRLYREHLPNGIVPQRSAAITPRYILAHRLLGFGWAVRLGKLLKR